MKKLLLTSLLLSVTAGTIALAWISLNQPSKKAASVQATPGKDPDHTPRHDARMHSIAKQAKNFVRDKQYNTAYCFLIDMSISSGQNRFFVYDLEKDSVIKKGLVTHGRCNEDWLEGRRYSNTVGSGCTSLGKYRIGPSYSGRFGLAFKLHGLESTNNNAFRRYVVLHSHECVPENEVEGEICQSDGCPTVSINYLRQLESMIRSSGNPVLLWIYE